MKPYLAVIYDSFFDAFKSRVLYVLLLGWTLLLAILAPFGWIEGTNYEFNEESIVNRDRLIAELVQAGDGKSSKAQQRVWDMLDKTYQDSLKAFANSDGSGNLPIGKLAFGLNVLLKKKDLYDPEIWPTASKRKEIESELAVGDTSKLSEEQLAKVNRRLVELAFPVAIRHYDGTTIWIGYAGFKIGNPIIIRREQLVPFIEAGIMPSILWLALGVIGVFIAIVVTSNLIPDMFSTGAISLLLSKPISRSGLLIAKYVGGIGFITINIVYLVVGFFLLAGYRLGIWNTGLLWCIPVFVFVFMIYYSVSVFFGLVSKNAIVSIVSTVLFWALCFVLGITYGYMRATAVDQRQLTSITEFDGLMIGGTTAGDIVIWDADEAEWKNVGSEAFGGRRLVGAHWDDERQQVWYARARYDIFQGINTRDVELNSLNVQVASDSANDKSTFDASVALNDTRRIDTLAKLPQGTQVLRSVQNELMAAGDQGIYRFNYEASKAESTSASQGGLFNLPFLKKVDQAFKQLTDPSLVFMSPLALSEVLGSRDLIVLARNTLYYLAYETEADRYVVKHETRLEMSNGTLFVLAADATHAVVVTDDEKAWSINLADFRVDEIEQQPIKDAAPQSIRVHPSGSGFVLLQQNGQLWTIDSPAKQFVSIELSNKVTAFDVSHDKLIVVTEGNTVSSVDPANGQQDVVVKPRLSTVAKVFYGIINPLYTINPKPAATQELIAYAIIRDDPLSFGMQNSDLEQARPKPRVWGPILSNLAFIVVMLSLSCFYLHRQDI